MNSSTVDLLDLPDEMLIEILKKLSNIDVLYSILSVNKRLDRLARDSIFTHFIDMTIKTPYDGRCSISNVLLEKFCSSILRQIHYNIKCFLLEPFTMESILVAYNYPKLDKLILYSIKPKDFLNYLSDDSPILHIFQQITHLEMITDKYYNTRIEFNLNVNAYDHLLSVCHRLTHLNINGKCALPLTMCSSSVIVELNVNVDTINDCLRLLDGRFNKMKSFIVKIDTIGTPSSKIQHQDNLPNLTTLSFSCVWPTKHYDNVIIPLLRRMPNMEEITLIFFVENRSKFIDGIHLYNEILVYMPRIIKFMFDITTIDHRVSLKYWLTNDDIEESFTIDDGHPYIYCSIDYFTNGIGRCRISTCPFDQQFRYFL